MNKSKLETALLARIACLLIAVWLGLLVNYVHTVTGYILGAIGLVIVCAGAFVLLKRFTGSQSSGN